MLSKSLLRRLSVSDLKEAIRQKSQLGKVEALESKREELLRQVAKLDKRLSKLNGNGSASVSKAGRKPGRKKGFKLSAATRRKMSEAAKRRYAGKGKDEAPPSGNRKRKSMSPETRAKMAEAARRRWAKVKGQS